MELFSFNGYHGTVETSVADNVLHGKVLFIGDLITYEADTLAQLQKEFQAAVTDYLETCESIGKKPEKSLSGQFNVRPGEELHKRLMVRALQDEKSLNAVVIAAMESYLRPANAPVLNHVHTHQHTVTVAFNEQEHIWSTAGSPVQYLSSTGRHESTNRH